MRQDYNQNLIYNQHYQEDQQKKSRHTLTLNKNMIQSKLNNNNINDNLHELLVNDKNNQKGQNLLLIKVTNITNVSQITTCGQILQLNITNVNDVVKNFVVPQNLISTLQIRFIDRYCSFSWVLVASIQQLFKHLLVTTSHILPR